MTYPRACTVARYEQYRSNTQAAALCYIPLGRSPIHYWERHRFAICCIPKHSLPGGKHTIELITTESPITHIFRLMHTIYSPA